ncbi:MAG: hypothetical protein V2A74_08795 [bacterium]
MISFARKVARLLLFEHPVEAANSSRTRSRRSWKFDFVNPRQKGVTYMAAKKKAKKAGGKKRAAAKKTAKKKKK